MTVKMKMAWKDKGWAALQKRVTAGPAATFCRVGFFGPEAEAMHGDSGLTVNEIGIINEFGSDDGHTPARSFLRRTFNWKRGSRAEVLHQLAKVSRMVMFQGYTRISAMKASGIGPWAVAKVQATINSGVGPANRPETVREKGHDLTLRDTLAMAMAISYEIIAGGIAMFRGVLD